MLKILQQNDRVCIEVDELVRTCVCKRVRQRFCCTEQICRAKVKVTAGLLPARGRGNLNQQLQHERALAISSQGVK